MRAVERVSLVEADEDADSVSDLAEDVVGVIRAGARGSITKGLSGAEVSAAVRAIASGDAVFSPRLAGFVLAGFVVDAFGAVAGEKAASAEELDRLSAREHEVMRLTARAAHPRRRSAPPNARVVSLCALAHGGFRLLAQHR